MVETPAGRTCVFCGGPADSREHVFAKRLCKRAGAVRFPVIQGLYTEAVGTVTRKQHAVEAFQVRHVCVTCNNTWMNDLEAWFEARLGCLIEPQWPKLALTMIETLRAERAQLAHWLMKTAITFSLACLQGKMRVEFPPEITKQVKDGVVPDHCWVDLAYTDLGTLGGAFGRCFRVMNGGKYNACQVLTRGFGFRFAVQFNHLLLRIARASGANVTYQSRNGELPVRLYPTANPRLPGNFTYQDIISFEHSVVLETWKGCPGNVP
jgi:hypothetical protein